MELKQEWVKDAYEKILLKMEKVSERSKDKIPYTTINGVHDDKSDGGEYAVWDGIDWWTNGSWAGILWQMYLVTNDNRYAEIARKTEEKLEACLRNTDRISHDTGFVFLPCSVLDYRLTKNPDSRRQGLLSANLLAARFNYAGKYIRAWNNFGGVEVPGWTIIDSLFVIPILFWASQELEDPRFTQIAEMHADTLAKHFVRPDGSVPHIVEFDPFSGEKVREHAGQGYAVGSAWSRGQAWGLYGFYIAYHATKKTEYLDTAKHIASYFIANIPHDGILPVDFKSPEEPFISDDSAAAIAACGLLELAAELPEEEKDMYQRAALKLLKALYDQHCDFSLDTDHILTNCAVAYHRPDERDMSLIYGDYFFIEAIFKIFGKGKAAFLI